MRRHRKPPLPSVHTPYHFWIAILAYALLLAGTLYREL